MSAHFTEQRYERGLDLLDGKNAIEHATGCSPYATGAPRHGGSCWRIYGPGIDVERIVVACEAYKDGLGEQCILITIVDENEE